MADATPTTDQTVEQKTRQQENLMRGLDYAKSMIYDIGVDIPAEMAFEKNLWAQGIFKNASHGLDGALIGAKIYEAPATDKLKTVVNESLKTILSSSAGNIVEVGALFLIGAEAAPAALLLGAATTVIANIGQDSTRADYYTPLRNLGNGLYSHLYHSTKGDVTEQYDLKKSLSEFSRGSEVSRVQMDGTHIKIIEFTSGGAQVKLDLAGGTYQVNQYSGKLSDKTMDASAKALLNKVLDDFNTQAQGTAPGFDVRTQLFGIQNQILGPKSFVLKTQSGESSYHSDTLNIEGKNSDGGKTVTYKDLTVYEKSDGGVSIKLDGASPKDLKGVIFNSDGSKVLYYMDSTSPQGYVVKTFRNLGELSGNDRTIAEKIYQETTQKLHEGGKTLLLNNPEFTHDLGALKAHGDLQPVVSNLVYQGKNAAVGSDQVHVVTPETTLLSTDGITKYQATELPSLFKHLSDVDLADLARNGKDSTAELRGDVFWALYNRAKTWGVASTDNVTGNKIYGLSSGIYLERVVQPGTGKTIEVLKYASDPKPLGAVTTYQKDSFQHQVTEIFGGAQNSMVVEITTTDNALNKSFTGGDITLKLPDDFVFNKFGGYVGELLGQQLADTNAYKGILYGSTLQTLMQSQGSFIDLMAHGNQTLDAIFGAVAGAKTSYVQSMPDLFEGFAKNLTGSITASLSQAISGKLGAAAHIGGVGGEIFQTELNAVTMHFTKEAVDVVFKDLPLHVTDGSFDFHFTKIDFAAALANYAASRLAGDIVHPESQVAAIFGSIGAYVGSSIASVSAIAGSIGGPIGSAIGAFIGNIAGTAIGNLIGGGAEHPASWAKIGFERTQGNFVESANWGHDGANANISDALAEKVLAGVNHILDLTHGALRSTATSPGLTIGWQEGHYAVVANGKTSYFDRSGDAVEYASFRLLKDFDLVGGHTILMRAWHNSDATDLRGFQKDIQVAESFQAYLTDPTSVITFMMDQPDSENAKIWASILQRAAEMKLHVPSPYDNDGGWSELLKAHGDINPEFIPEIKGDSLVLTDPSNDAKTVLEHVTGPGYEIVHLDGSDGSDVLRVTVNGPSIGYLKGGAGADWLVGGDGHDILLGGDGNDTLDGGAGNDWLNGQGGDDLLNGDAGDDMLIGSSGNDTLNGGPGIDHIYGGDGNDILQGQGVNDTLEGGNGNDILYGYESHDRAILIGGDGNDTIYGKTNDYVLGGAGNDVIQMSINNAHQYNNIIEFQRGDGRDTVTLEGTSSKSYQTIMFDQSIGINELWFSTSKDGRDLILSVLGEDQSVTIKNYTSSYFTVELATGYYRTFAKGMVTASKGEVPLSTVTPTGKENLLPDATLNALTGGAAANWNFHNDIPIKDVTSGRIYDINNSPRPVLGMLYGGGANADNLSAYTTESSRYYASGGSGDDVLGGTYTNRGSYYLFGDSGNDTLIGGVSSAKSHDLLVGGLGNDSIIGNSGNDSLYGSQGDDSLYGGSGTDLAHGGSGKDLIYGDSNNDMLYGDSGNDTIYGGDDNDHLYGGDESDRLFGGNGDDQLNGQSGMDYLWGDAGNDVLSGGIESDELHGGDNNDLLNGDEGNDSLFGENGADDLNGGVDNDTLYGGDGNDTLDGGDGNDSLYGDAGDDVLRDSAGANRLEGGDGNDTLTGGLGRDTLAGGNGDDTLSGGANRDQLAGNDGNDRVDGGDGNDLVTGGAGNDIVQGGAGDDRISGGNGADTLSGGEGADIFIYESRTVSTEKATDVIQDWGPTDIISLAGLNFTGIAAGTPHDSMLGYNIVNHVTYITASGSDFKIALLGDHTLTNADFVF